MSDHLVTAMASASLAAQPTPPPRVNFPIPQELRDEIYEYLLSSKIVNNGMRYHFNTELFGINKTIKQEAEEWLHKHNLFVVVSYKWPRDLPKGLLSIVPRLCTSKETVQKMKHYSLHIHLTSSLSKKEKAPRSIWSDEILPGRTCDTTEWMLILEQDLDIFAAVFGLFLQTRKGKSVLIGSKGGQMNLEVRPRNETAAMSVHFKLMDTEHRPMTPSLQHKLFDNLQDMLVGESMKVKFSPQGCTVDPQMAARLVTSIGPQVVWSNARKWMMLVQMRKVKWACDEEVKDGNDERALCGLSDLLLWINRLVDLDHQIFPGLPYKDDIDVAIRIRVYDCLVSKAWLALRLSKMQEFFDTMDTMVKTRDPEIHHRVSYWTWLGGHHLLNIYTILLNTNTWTPEFTNRKLIENLSLDSEDKQGPYLTHDIKVIKERADLDKAPTCDILPLELCSIRTMRPSTARFMSYGTGDPPENGKVPKRPRTNVGWVNIDHIGKFSAEEKQRISEKQKSNGLEVTDLDSVARDIERVRFSWQDWKD